MQSYVTWFGSTSVPLCHVSAQVLFDVLKSHGGSFAESFWSRIFDRVLLPIFDHVRAEVTDTTTFTSERRRQQEDAWLYETCTHCLQVGTGGSVQDGAIHASPGVSQ
jgi:hypothetical protein